jgi:hypothetical protein
VISHGSMVGQGERRGLHTIPQQASQPEPLACDHGLARIRLIPEARMNSVRVFVSSTFLDMHAERDYLNGVVFPELRSRCAKRGADFVGVDLRWG